ncbi:diguanylate cyclase [Tamilnaduibacter salinus]|uniref:diguanylate cyclase n=1 Tax=Tamilnaduibacter salinus TaxID=1484056 RepID=A0A2U1CYD3_9GAMM|nr:7TM diverse intracellular signaling domain-containing protein [Tamilnaduibacter salinus]PVY77502.1 diguanylate cyclase [Tamilnaduibacter salinus]
MSHRRRLATLVLLGLAILMAPAYAGAFVVDNDTRSVLLGPHLEFLKDPEGVLSLSDARSPALADRWRAARADIPNFGYTDAVYWTRVTLPPAQGERRRFMVEIDYPVLDRLDVSLWHGGEQLRSFRLGDRIPYAERPVDHPGFVFPVHLSGGQPTDLYMRVQTSSSLQLPIRLWRPEALIGHDFERATAFALFYGAMLIMAIYNLLIFLAVRDASYLYYVFYVLSMVALVAGIHGVTFKYFWPGSTGLNDVSLILALSGMVFFPSLFTRHFLKMPQDRPRMAKMLVGLAALAVLTAIGSFFLPYRELMVTTIMLAGSAIVLNFASGIVRWWDGFHAARYYNLAWTFMLGGGLIMLLNKIGVAPRNWFTENAGQIGTSAEVLLLSFALANRMSYERRKREEAQRQSAQAQQELLDAQVAMNRDLDCKVRERTEALEEANAKLQEISITDGLTGLRNRRYFDQTFEMEYRRAYREKYPLAVLMIDIDHFKPLNDEHGHPFGDHCLRQVASVIRDCIRRPPDLAARYGGEEFVVLLPNTDRPGGVSVAEAIRRAVADSPVRDAEQSVSLTVSIGVAAEIPADVRETHEALLNEADRCLYEAKNDGRNRVSVGYAAACQE